jgi:hypothetical protein
MVDLMVEHLKHFEINQDDKYSGKTYFNDMASCTNSANAQ